MKKDGQNRYHNPTVTTLGLGQPVRLVIELLVKQNYSELESLTKGIRLSAQDMMQAITAYKRKLVMPPDDSYKLMDVVAVKNAEPPRWSIVMPLWTEEEGRSDLSVELTVIKEADGFRIELNDMHVH